MASAPKNLYIYKLAGIVSKHNNTYHSTIEMKPIDVKLSTFVGFGVKNNEHAGK